jgi:hypothetical protein
MNKGLLVLVFLMGGTVTLLAQQKKPAFWVYGQTVEDRASTRLGYWKTNANAGVGEVVISYGRPVWKAQYQDKLDEMTRGKMWRMGDNFWTLLDTNLPVEFGGKKISPGLYYLAVHRSENGKKWELVFIDPDVCRSKGLDAYDVGTRPSEIPVLFQVPLSFERSDDIVERLTILMTLGKDSQTAGTMRLSWGSFALAAPVRVDLPKSD